jgi:hypothetical protein
MITPPDEATIKRRDALAAGEPFTITIHVAQIEGGFRAEARWDEAVLATTEAEDSIAAYVAQRPLPRRCSAAPNSPHASRTSSSRTSRQRPDLYTDLHTGGSAIG